MYTPRPGNTAMHCRLDLVLGQLTGALHEVGWFWLAGAGPSVTEELSAGLSFAESEI